MKNISVKLILVATLILYWGHNSDSGVTSEGHDPRSILLEARTVARAIPETNQRAAVLHNIAQAQVNAHDPQAALDTFNGCPECYPGLLTSIAREFAEAGQEDRALELLDIIKRDRTKIEIPNLEPNGPPSIIIHGDSDSADVLSRIATTQARRGDLSAARETMKKLSPGQHPGMSAVIAIASEQIKAGDWFGASQTVKAIMGTLWVSETAWRCMLQAAFPPPSVGEIYKHIEAIEDPQTRSFALSGLALVQLSRSDHAGALETSKMIDPGYASASAYKALAEASLFRGDRTNALAYLKEAVASAKVIPGHLARADTLWRLSSTQAKAGAITDALETARAIEIEYHYIEAIREIAVSQAKNGDIKETLATLSFLKHPLLKEKNYEGAVCNTAFLLSLSGKIHNARMLVEQANEHNVESCLLSIASGQAQAGDVVGAEATIAQVKFSERRASRQEQISRLQAILQESPNRDEILKQISRLLTEEGHWQSLGEFLAEARAKTGDVASALTTLDSYNSYNMSTYRYVYLDRIASAMVRGGHAGQALSWARTLGDQKEKSHALLGIANGLISGKLGLEARNACNVF